VIAPLRSTLTVRGAAKINKAGRKRQPLTAQYAREVLEQRRVDKAAPKFDTGAEVPAAHTQPTVIPHKDKAASGPAKAADGQETRGNLICASHLAPTLAPRKSGGI
jgi:hypothetical protein